MGKKYAELIHEDGRVERIYPKNGKTFQFEGELYGLLGCDMIQDVQLRPNLSGQIRSMLLDEEGKFDSTKKPNAKATAHLMNAGGIPGDYVVGPVVICAVSRDGEYVPHLEE